MVLISSLLLFAMCVWPFGAISCANSSFLYICTTELVRDVRISIALRILGNTSCLLFSVSLKSGVIIIFEYVLRIFWGRLDLSLMSSIIALLIREDFSASSRAFWIISFWCFSFFVYLYLITLITIEPITRRIATMMISVSMTCLWPANFLLASAISVLWFNAKRSSWIIVSLIESLRRIYSLWVSKAISKLPSFRYAFNLDIVLSSFCFMLSAQITAFL